MVEVLAKITTQRSQDITLKGFDFGYEIPKQRIHPLIKPHLDSVFFIAEIKRSSPSAGTIKEIPSVTKLAGDYLNGGAGAISVLCEEHYFGGSLLDLMSVKSAYPNACILRKDFIQYPQEVDVSYRAGADMVLLIVAMFINEDGGFSHFKMIYEECLKVGITPLIEVHTQAEIDFIAPLQAPLIGINSRSLHTFEINIPAACALKNALSHSKIIFESGIDSPYSAFITGSLDFDGLLCGSYLVSHKNPTTALQSLKHAFTLGKTQKPRFYRQIFESLSAHSPQSRPLLKICGITNLDDALMVGQEKIDMLGFILVKHSPRYIESKQIKDIAKALQKLYPHILRIAVINDDKQALNEAKSLYQQGYIDAIQLHALNLLTPDIFAKSDLKEALFCFYPVQNIAHIEDFTPYYEGIFCLVDSKSAQGGGSGQSINKDVLRSLQERYLCIAGGINPHNIGDFLALKPTLLDINSGIEKEVGKKDIHKLRALLDNLKNAIKSTKEQK